MAEKNITPSFARSGMNKDVHFSSLKPEEYTHAKNTNFSNETGNGWLIQNEHSNILASKFKDDYVVVGYKNDIFLNRTFYFLYNKDLGVSEIGVIKQTQSFDENNTITSEHQTYETLLEDSCLNFSTTKPIKTIEIHVEKLGTVIYWTDDFNPPRYLNIDKLDEYTTGGVVDCDMLRMFKEPEVLELEPTEIVLGGRLKRGVYQAIGAYCDILGNEQSRYFSLTNPINIFDEQNNILEQSEIADETSFAIKIKAKNLDKGFSHYKVVFVQKNDINSSTTYIEEGIYSTSDDTVVFDTDDNKKRTTIDALAAPAIKIERAKQLKEINNTLFLNGITNKKVPNLQKVVNLLGIYIQWQSYIATEDLYKNGVSSSKYKGYFRDEVVPLAIRFIKDGDYTPNYPLIGRPLIEGEDDEIEESNQDFKSVNKLNKDNPQITKKWQLYNTASVEEKCVTQGEITYKKITENVTKVTTVSNIGEVTNGFFTLPIESGEIFDDLKSYLNENIEELQNTDSSELDGSLADLVELLNLDSSVNDENNFPIYDDPCIDPDTGEECVDPDTGEVIKACDQINESNYITGGYLVEEEIEIADIEKETLRFKPFNFPDNYPRVKIQRDNPCNLFENKSLVGWSGSGRIFKRRSSIVENECRYAKIIQKKDSIEDLTYPAESFSYYGGISFVDVLSEKVAFNEGQPNNAPNYTDGFGDNIRFEDKVAKNAAWYEYTPQNKEDTFILDISGSIYSKKDKLGAGNIYRVSIYNSCSNSAEPIFYEFFDSREGVFFRFKKEEDSEVIESSTGKIESFNSINSKYYIAVENGILEFRSGVDFDEEAKDLVINYENEPTNPNFLSLGSQGCYSITVYPEQYEKVEVEFDKLTTDKRQTWSSPCEFNVPNLKNNKAIPFEKGFFGYVESLEEYPENKDLFDSSLLDIAPEDFSDESITKNNNPISFRDFFESFYTNGIQDEKYVLKEDTDFTGKKIRHFKLPDNNVSPFITYTRSAPFTKSLIYPLGITINEKIINDFLDIALKNNLITKEQRQEIKGYEILRGDREADKSVIARGITFDLYKYTEKGREVHYANYPFNSLGDDIMHYDTSKRDTFIKHPFDSQKNYNWTFHSPDTDYKYDFTPSAHMVIDGYLYGQSEAHIDVVRDHPKYTILGKKLKRLASSLATIEMIAEVVSQIADMTSRGWVTIGVSGGSSVPFTAIGIALVAVFKTLAESVFKYARYKYQWLETFRNLGKRRDFAYFMTSHGYYNYFKPNLEKGDTIRYLNLNAGLNEGRFSYIDSVGGSRLEINNIDREKTTLLSVGEDFPINYNSDYTIYDNPDQNPNLASRTFNSVDGICNTGMSDAIRSNVASMYVTLKNYLPSQYGTIGSIKWLTTGYKGDLSNTKTSCFGIFGGDCYITRHTFRRGFPFFNTTAMNQADMTPFEYKFYTNIGKEPRFFLNFGIDSEEREGGKLLPFSNSEYSLDCLDDRDSYIKEPSKFYLEYNGIPNFLVESTVNTWHRYGKPEPWNNFFPNVGDKMEWTQLDTNPSRRGNNFYYNKNYSAPPLRLFQNVLPVDYNQEDYDIKTDAPNGTRYSLPDNSENESVNPWLIFRPLNSYEFKTNYGKFTGMSELENGQVLVTFENTSVIFNAVDQIVDDGQDPQSQNLGTGAIFRRRPVTMSDTELGYRGSQNFQILGTPNGHIFIDAKRGQIFLKPIGQNGFEEISKSYQGKPTYMESWFKEQLPFKILKNVPDYDIDNPYNGVGITMGYDSRYNRIFITKKDYAVKDLSNYCQSNGVLYNENEESNIINQYESLGFDYKNTTNCIVNFEKITENIQPGTDIFAVFDTSGSFNGDGLDDLRTAMQDFFDNYSLDNPDFQGNYYPINSSNERWLGNTSLISNQYAGEDLNEKDVLFVSFCNEAATSYHSTDTNLTQQQIDKYNTDYNNFVSLYNNLGSFKGVSYPIITTGASGSGSSLFATQGRYFVLQNLYAFYGNNITQSEADSIAVNSYFSTSEWNELKTALVNSNPYNLQGLVNYGWSVKPDLNDLDGTVITSQRLDTDLKNLISGIDGEQEAEKISIPLPQVDVSEFDDVSWTVAFSFDIGRWTSFYDFKPNFYVNHNDYFQTGLNVSDSSSKKGLWTHLLTNKSYQTFYGESFDWEIELPIQNKQVNKYLQSFAYRLDSRKYLNETEYYKNQDLGFDEAFIYNGTNSTGTLKLDLQRTLRQLSQYPILESNSQRILQTQQDGEFRFNYFYNRVANESIIKSLLKYDENYIDREVNDDAISFTSKKILERMRGTSFLVNLRSSDTEHKKLLEITTMSENIYNK